MLNLTSNRKWQPPKNRHRKHRLYQWQKQSPAQYHQALIAIVLKQRVASPYHLYDDGKCLWKEADVTHKKAQYAMFCTNISVCLQAQEPFDNCLPLPLAHSKSWVPTWQWRAYAARNLCAPGPSAWASVSLRCSGSKPATPPSALVLSPAPCGSSTEMARWATWRHQKQT